MRRPKIVGAGIALAAAGSLALVAGPSSGAPADVKRAVRPTAVSSLVSHPLQYDGEVGSYKKWLQGTAFWNGVLDAAAQAARPRTGGGGGGGGSCDREVNYGDGDGSYSIPANVVQRESGGNYGSCNESSGACGAYQVLNSTWAGYGGYGSACDAPPAVQDQWAGEAYAQAGCDPWGGC